MRLAATALPFDANEIVIALAVVAAAFGPVVVFLRWLFGPLFTAEAARLARYGRPAWLRAGYAGAILLALFIYFPEVDVVTPKDLRIWADEFSRIFLRLQSFAVAAMIPLIFAGAISDEKERGTLDFLLTSELTSREIILGKYGSRLLGMGGILLTGLPVLALTALWGGTDLRLVVGVFAVTFIALFSLGAVSLLCSVFLRRTGAATALAYFLIVPFFLVPPWDQPIVASPMLYQSVEWVKRPIAPVVHTPPQHLARYALMHGTIAIAALGMAIVFLRRFAAPRPSPPVSSPVVNSAIPILIPVQVSRTAWRPIGDDAVRWKERYHGRTAEPFADSVWLYFIVLIGVVVLFGVLIDEKYLGPTFPIILTLIAAFLTIGLGVGVMLQLSGTICRERRLQTLESLAALPESRGRILASKVIGAFERRIRWVIVLAGLLIGTALTGQLSIRSAMAMAAIVVAQIAFVAAVSLLVSIRSHSLVRANVTALGAIAAVWIATGLIARTRGIDSPPLAALFPFEAWRMAYDLNFSEYSPTMLSVALAGSVSLYLFAAIVIGAVAYWRFRRLDEYT